MYDGISGKEFEADIFIGTVYYQRLRHMISDKFVMIFEIVKTRASIDIKPNVFNRDFDNMVLMVKEKNSRKI